MALVEAVRQQLEQVWGRLSAGHKIILLLLCVLCATAIAAVALWSSSPDYEILYTGLTAEDCASLRTSFKEAGIPARVADGGSAIMVASRRINDARMAAAEKGIPNAARGGFDTFLNPKIGMTPFAEKINFVSALQNELATTIMSLQPVMYARVHLVLPERSLFREAERKPSASVLVITRGGQKPTAGQIAAIRNLVASAVEGLGAEDVTIADGKGSVLAGAGQGSLEMTAGDQFSHRQKVEAYLSGQAEAVLARVLGGGRCEVRVSAELSFVDMKETTREYDPDKKVLVSEQIETTKSSGGGVQVGGVAGMTSNVPGGSEQPAGASSAPGQQSTTESVNTKYVPSESVRETVQKGAAIKRLSVAAFVDLSPPQGAEESGAEESEGEEPTKMPALVEIESLIKDAIGFDETRGDTLKIVQATFQSVTADLSDMKQGALGPWLVSAGEYFAIGVLALALLLIARRALKSIEDAAVRQVITPEIVGMDGGESTALTRRRDELIQQEIGKVVAGDPEAAGRLLEGWVEEE